jgi:hypothetical protein
VTQRLLRAAIPALLAAGAGCGTGEGRAEVPPPAEHHASDWAAEDWAVLGRKVRWGVEHGLDTLPVGTSIVRLAETFVGATYTPATLEVPGPERVVVNLREFDCVTLIENVLALVRFIRQDGAGLLEDPPAAQARYEAYLEDLRYRDGVVDGYPSRLHYFSEWLADNERRGRLRVITPELGGVRDERPIGFMTSHPDSYRQLADPGVVEDIRAMEARLNRDLTRWYIPEGRIRDLEDGIEDGDIIAARSTLDGLDVAHTGFAIWRGGRLHLLHAPLVGKVVEISEVPLAERIQRIRTQDGILVGRVSAP